MSSIVPRSLHSLPSLPSFAPSFAPFLRSFLRSPISSPDTVMVKAVIRDETQLKSSEARLEQSSSIPVQVLSLSSLPITTTHLTPSNDAGAPSCSLAEPDKRKGPKAKLQASDAQSVLIDKDWDYTDPPSQINHHHRITEYHHRITESPNHQAMREKRYLNRKVATGRSEKWRHRGRRRCGSREDGCERRCG